MNLLETVKLTRKITQSYLDAAHQHWMSLANENTTVELKYNDYDNSDEYVIKLSIDGKVAEAFQVDRNTDYICYSDKINNKNVVFINGEVTKVDVMRDGDKYCFTKIGPNKWEKCSDGISIIVEDGKIIERLHYAYSEIIPATDDELSIIKKFGLMDRYNAKLDEMNVAFNKLEAIEIGY
jgi:hypothetical protein